MLIVGHRGAAGLVPENTLPSFARAYALGVDAVELDVYAHQGKLWVIHDDRLDRTTNSQGKLLDFGIQDLRAVDAGLGAQIPWLDEVFEQLPASVSLNIELKGPSTAAPVAQLLNTLGRQFNLNARVLVSGFDHQALFEFRTCAEQLGLDCRVAPLFSRWHSSVWHTAEALGATYINLAAKITTKKRVEKARSLGLGVLVYTVNNLATFRKLAKWGVSGVFTDRPDKINNRTLKTI